MKSSVWKKVSLLVCLTLVLLCMVSLAMAQTEKPDHSSDEIVSSTSKLTEGLNYYDSASGVQYRYSGGVIYITGYYGSSSYVYIPSSIKGVRVQGIRQYAFMDNTRIYLISVPSSVTKIGSGAFDGCTNLTYLYLGSGVKEIPADMCSGCSNLKNVSINGAITSIGNGAFMESGITSFKFPSSLKTIGIFAFTGSSLTSADLSKTKVSDFTQTFLSAKSLKAVTLPITAKKITGAFYGCSSLTKITMQPNLPALGVNAFAYCTSLQYVNNPASDGGSSIPSSVKTIPSQCYRNTRVNYVDIPPSVTSIESKAFADNPSIETISIPPEVTYIASDAFDNCPKLEMYVQYYSTAYYYAINHGISYEAMEAEAFAFGSIEDNELSPIRRGNSFKVMTYVENGVAPYYYTFVVKNSKGRTVRTSKTVKSYRRLYNYTTSISTPGKYSVWCSISDSRNPKRKYYDKIALITIY